MVCWSSGLRGGGGESATMVWECTLYQGKQLHDSVKNPFHLIEMSPNTFRMQRH